MSIQVLGVYDIYDLIKQFLCCTPISIINYMFSDEYNDYNIDVDAQKRILDNTVNLELVKRYPIKVSYQRAFLKWLINKIEEKGDPMHEEICEIYTSLLQVPDNKNTHFRHFLLHDTALKYITVEESTSMISNGTTGLCSWQAAVVLSEWCVQNKSMFSGNSVLELGCGVGLMGLILVATCCPKEYIFSDCHPAVLELACKNVKLNFQSNNEENNMTQTSKSERLRLGLKYNSTAIKVIDLMWEEIDHFINEQLGIPEIVIASDVVYDTCSSQILVEGLKSLMNIGVKYCIIAATVRNAETISKFLDAIDILIVEGIISCRELKVGQS